MTRASERTMELRGLLQRLRTLTKDLDKDTPLPEVVCVGRELWRFVETATEEIEKCKARLRDEAGTVPGPHEFEGHDNTLGLVVIPEPHPVMRKGTGEPEIETLTTALGPELFHQLFQVKQQVRPRHTFTEDVTKLDPLKASVALDAVDTEMSKPRVSFRKR